MIDLLQPWVRLGEVITLLSPVFLFSILSSLAIYVAFVLTATTASHSSADPIGGATPPPLPDTPAPQQLDKRSGDEFGNAGSFSYLLLASVFGLVFGMLIKLVGGFSALEKATSSTTLIGAISTALVLVLGVAGSLFADSDRINLRKPLGAIAFLLSFLVSGFYWKLLEKAI